MTQFKTLDTWNSDAFNGTHLQGEIVITYDELVSIFGQPIDGDGYKVDAEWLITFDDGRVATIYNWKSGRNYLGRDGMDTEAILDWHIGGRDKTVVDTIHQIIKHRREKRIEEPK